MVVPGVGKRAEGWSSLVRIVLVPNATEHSAHRPEAASASPGLPQDGQMGS